MRLDQQLQSLESHESTGEQHHGNRLPVRIGERRRDRRLVIANRTLRLTGPPSSWFVDEPTLPQRKPLASACVPEVRTPRCRHRWRSSPSALGSTGSSSLSQLLVERADDHNSIGVGGPPPHPPDPLIAVPPVPMRTPVTDRRHHLQLGAVEVGDHGYIGPHVANRLVHRGEVMQMHDVGSADGAGCKESSPAVDLSMERSVVEVEEDPIGHARLCLRTTPCIGTSAAIASRPCASPHMAASSRATSQSIPPKNRRAFDAVIETADRAGEQGGLPTCADQGTAQIAHDLGAAPSWEEVEPHRDRS